MTREEASIIIGNIPIVPDECYTVTEYQEAKGMAIEALKEPSGELISHEAIKDLYNKMQNACCAESYLDFNGTHYTSDMGYAFEGMEIL